MAGRASGGQGKAILLYEAALGLGPKGLNSGQANWVGDGLSDGRVATQLPQVCEQAMSAIQQPKFAVLIWLDVVNKLGSSQVPVGATLRKIALKNPVAKRLGDHRRTVVPTGCAGNGFDISRGGSRCNSIDRG